jgi:cytochrome P450
MQDALTAPFASPPLPLYRGHGVLSALGDIQQDPLRTFEAASRLGDVVQLKMPLDLKTVLLVSSPALAEQIFVTRQKRYGKITRGYVVLRRLLLGNGLLTSEGDFWLKQRRTAQPAFHRDRIRGFADTMIACTEEATLPEGVRFDMHEAMMRLTLRIVGLTLLSTDVTKGDAAAVGDALSEVIEQFMWRTISPWALPLQIPTPQNRRFAAARRELDRVVSAIIEQRVGAAPKNDLLGMLLEATDPETGDHMSPAQLKDEVMTMFLAGHETTANALSWTFWLLAQHPEVEARVRSELDAVLAGRAPAVEDVAKLTYLGAVLKEALRLYPPAWIVARGALEDDVIGGYPVEKGTFVLVSPWILHRRANAWPDAEAFSPERWLDGGGPAHKLSYLPFLTGPRKCIGDAFAIMEATLVLALLLERYRFRAAAAVVEPEPAITLRPRNGLPMIADRAR